MNAAKCDDLDYIHSLIAAKKTFTCTEAARCQPESQNTPAHDAFTRLLQRQPLETKALWREAKAFVEKEKGLLVIDDTTLDKPYAQKMELLTYHWSGKHQRVVKGIAILTLLWTDGKALIPCHFRVYDKSLNYRNVGHGLCPVPTCWRRLRPAPIGFVGVAWKPRPTSFCKNFLKRYKAIVRDTIRTYLAQPFYELIPTA